MGKRASEESLIFGGRAPNVGHNIKALKKSFKRFEKIFSSFRQCDQMTKIVLLNIWPLATMKICPEAKLWHSRFRLILPNAIKMFKKLPKWQKFAQIWSH